MEPLFVIDTKKRKKRRRKELGDSQVAGKEIPATSSAINLTDGIEFGDISSTKKKKQTLENSSDVDVVLHTNILKNRNSALLSETGKLRSIDEIMKKSVLTPGLEKCEALPMPEVNRRKLSKLKKLERERTKGSMWFNMPAPEVTEEMKHDLEVLQMRSVLDPKHFYKKNDLKVLPKYFQVGRVIEAPADFYHSRVPKKMRKRTIVEELLADAEFQKYNKKRYKEIIEQRRKTHFKAHKQAKKLKKKKRRH